MVGTPTTRVLAIMFHKHKYISNPSVTPADAVVAAAQHFAAALKGKMPRYLKEALLEELTHLSAIFFDASAAPDATPEHPLPPH